MSDLFWLTDKQMRRIEPYFPLSHGIPRVDDKPVLSGIIFVIRNGLRWRDAPRDYGPHKTIYNRFIRWSRLGVFNRIFAELSAKGLRGCESRSNRFAPAPCPKTDGWMSAMGRQASLSSDRLSDLGGVAARASPCGRHPTRDPPTRPAGRHLRLRSSLGPMGRGGAA